VITQADILDTTPDAWIEACASYREKGLVSVDWLTAVDSGNAIAVLVHLVRPGTGDEVIVRCTLPDDARGVTSLACLFPGADWHERETAEMFGIEFLDRGDCAPLLLREEPVTPPMLRATALPQRINTHWPGAEEESTRRRRRMPPGVRAEWVDADE